MFEYSDWSQFLPQILAGIVLFFVPIVFGIVSKRVRDGYRYFLSEFRVFVLVLLKIARTYWNYSITIFAGLAFSIFIAWYYYEVYRDFSFIFVSSFWLGFAFMVIASFLPLVFPPQKTTVFKTISIPPGIGNSYLSSRFLDLPEGFVSSEDRKVGLHLKKKVLIFDTNEHIRDYTSKEDGSKVVRFTLKEKTKNIKSVVFIVNSGNSLQKYKNKLIGEIILVFEDAPPIKTELILGYNIREWAPGNKGDLVREASGASLRLFWKGLNKDGAAAIMDYLRVTVFECMNDNALKEIIFVHTPTRSSSKEMDVHYSIFGISLEVEKSQVFNYKSQ